MQVFNLHERVLPTSAPAAAALIDSLGSADDRLWPRDRWPPMRLDGPLGVGARGGHGPIRYHVERYTPGERVRFRFSAPRGFVGSHEFTLEPVPGGVRLRHVLQMRARGPARVTWPLVYRPLHDAVIEDALDRAEAWSGGSPFRRRWSPWVRALRALLKPRRRRERATATVTPPAAGSSAPSSTASAPPPPP